jgi:hypothetical protein
MSRVPRRSCDLSPRFDLVGTLLTRVDGAVTTRLVVSSILLRLAADTRTPTLIIRRRTCDAAPRERGRAFRYADGVRWAIVPVAFETFRETSESPLVRCDL